MKGRLRFSARSRDDIDEIWFYIADDDVDAANRFIESFEPIYDILADNPKIGRSRPELGPGLRSFPHKSCLIFYVLTDDGVLIHRVIHAARDIQEIFTDQ